MVQYMMISQLDMVALVLCSLAGTRCRKRDTETGFAAPVMCPRNVAHSEGLYGCKLPGAAPCPCSVQVVVWVDTVLITWAAWLTFSSCCSAVRHITADAEWQRCNQHVAPRLPAFLKPICQCVCQCIQFAFYRVSSIVIYNILLYLFVIFLYIIQVQFEYCSYYYSSQPGACGVQALSSFQIMVWCDTKTMYLEH